MDLKAILKRCGLEGELVDTIADTIKAEIPKEFVSKQQYNKKVGAIDELNNTIADLEAKIENSNTDEYKSKYEALQSEFDTYKNNIEVEKINEQKRGLLTEQLKKEGFNEKILKLLTKEIDLETLEIENDAIKDWDNIVNPLKENYSDFIKQESISGLGSVQPPTNTQTENNDNPLANALGKYL
ncbi:recombination related exonuclease [Clostridium phage vB_CpeP_PMQ04]|jgi:hypothetical protein|nr:recombination related exonuclease [Clostridium phage vB_CpeP_PMQ04]